MSLRATAELVSRRDEALPSEAASLLNQLVPARTAAEPPRPSRRPSRLVDALRKLESRSERPTQPQQFAQPETAEWNSATDREGEPAGKTVPVLENVTDSDTPDSSSVQTRDRRAYPRHDSECDVTVCIRSADKGKSFNSDWQLHAERVRGKIVDVSMGGIAMTSNSPIGPGERVLLRITNRNFSEMLETDASVLRCNPHLSGDWHVVCRLDRKLTFEQVNFIGKQLFASTLV